MLALRGKREATKAPTEEQKIATLFEEVKAMVRELPERLDRMGAVSTRESGRRFRRYSPRVVEELLFGRGLSDIEDGGILGLRMLLSMIRDDYPWLYESGLELERAIQSGNGEKIQKSLRQMHQVIEFTAHSLGSADKESVYMLDHLHNMIERAADRVLIRVQQRPAKMRRKSARDKSPL